MAKKITQEYILKVVASGLKEVTKEIQTLNTNLTGTDKSVASTGKAFDKTTKKQDTYMRGTKGAAQATNNSTKGFSKMAQNLNGTLVPAYATVAANVFALTAAFGALKRAADLEILVKSAETLAVQTGRSLTTLSKDMQDITNSTLTMKEALESASIAASAGFDNSTIKELTQVARNASVALGRDMTDSLNRVFKGAIKAEPELLDELGIILRLDPATRNYAAALGKSASALTTFEKQQAVVNAVLEQGQEKFGEFGDVDVNPYSQLSAAFQDISAVLIQLINIPISPVLQFFTENVAALTAAIVLFSASVLKRAFPALNDFSVLMKEKFAAASVAAAKSLKIAEDSNISFKRSLQGTDKASTKLLASFAKGVTEVQATVEGSKRIGKNFKEAFTIGTDSVKGLEAYKKALQQTINTLNRKGTKTSQGFGQEDVKFLKEELSETNLVLNKINKDTIALSGRFQSFGKGAAASIAYAKTQLVAFGAEVTKGATRGALAGYTDGFSGVSKVLGRITKQDLPLFTKGAKLAVASISGLGGAFLKMVPVIGQLVVAWSLLSAAASFVKDLFVEKDLVNLSETLEENTKALETAAKSAKFYNDRLKELPDTIDNIEKKTKLLSNTFGNLADNLNNTLKDIEIGDGFSGFDEFLDAFAIGNLDEFKDQLESARKSMEAFGYKKESNELLEEFGDLLRLSGSEAELAGEKIAKAADKIRKNQLNIQDLNNTIKSSLEGLSKGILALNGALPSLTGVEQGFIELDALLNGLNINNLHQVASAITSMSGFDLRELGLKDIANDMTAVGIPIKNLIDRLDGVKKKLAEVQKERDRASSYDSPLIEKQIFAETQTAYDTLKGLVKGYSLELENAEDKLNSYAEASIKQLEVIEERFKAIKNAQRDISDVRSLTKVAELEQGQGLESRLNALKSITEAENNYLSTISMQTERMKDSSLAAVNELEDKLKDATAKDKSGIIEQLKSERGRYQQLENKLLADRNKTVDNYIKQIKVVQKELSKNTKYAAAGLTVSKKHASIIQKDMYEAIVNLGLAHKKSPELAKSQADEMVRAAVAAEDYKTFLQTTRMPSLDAIITANTALDTRLETMGIESQYLEDNNILLSERIDKEFILAQAINDRLTTEAGLKVAELQETDPSSLNKETQTAVAQLNALQLKGLKIEQTKDKLVKSSSAFKLKAMKDELKASKAILALGVMASKKQLSDLKIQKELQKLTKAGYSDLEEFEKTLKDIAKVEFATDFNAGMADMVDSMSEYGTIIRELNDDLDNLGTTGQKFTAGLKAMSNIGEESGNNVTKAFADLAIVVDAYNEKLNAGTMAAGEWAAFTSSALGAMSQLYEDGSKESKNLIAIQQVLAVVAATIAVLEQGKGDPYTAFARMAAMAASVAALLTSSGIGGFGSSVSGATASEDYKESIGSQGLVGTELLTVSLIDSIDDLVSSIESLFSIERELQIAISGLNDTFSNIAYSMFGAFESTSKESFGVLNRDSSVGLGGFGDIDPISDALADIDPIFNSIKDLADDFLDAIGFSSKKVTSNVIDSGIVMGASIEALGDSLVGSLTDTNQYLVNEVTTVTSSWFGLKKKTSTRLETYYKSLPDTFENALSYALDKTLLVVTNLFRTFGDAVNVNLEALFSDLGEINISTLRISLQGKSAEEQSEALAAWFSNLGNEVIAKVVPFMDDYARAGEELLDTLIRITNTTIQLSNAFSTIDLNISAITDVSTINFSLMTDAAAEQLKLEMVAAWQESFTQNFTDMEEFSDLFTKFSNAIFSETELLEIAFSNSTDVVNAGFEILRAELTDTGNFDLLDTLGTENTDEALRAIYNLGVETNAFAAVIDSATGEIDTSGADLLTLFIQLGAALDDQSIAADELTDVLDNLNEQYERQIALFGLLDKELELLQLSFDFEDALKEAEETGTDLALVETYYGLLRLDIIREYNQQIVDALDDTMEAVSNSILSILQGANAWDEVAYQSILVTKIVDKLSISLGSLGNQIDFNVFDSLVDTTDFLLSLEEFIDVVVGEADSISDQIALVEDLREAVIDRYNAEIEAAAELESSIMDSISALKDLSSEINTWLDDLFVGDFSTLTGAEKLAEAQLQFDTNLENVLSQDTELADAAREDLLDSANTLLELANLFWAIGPEYQSIFNDVVSSLESIDEGILEEIGISEETLAITSLEESLTELQLQTITQLQTLDSILEILEVENATNLANELEAYFPEIVDNVTAITTKLEAINNDSWNPIYLELVDLNNTMNVFTSNLGSFAKGSEEIQYDQLAMIHKGETILTSDTSKAIRSGETIYGASEAVNTSKGDSSEVVDAIRILTQVVASGQEDMLEKNEELRVATKNIGTNIGYSQTASAKGII